MIQTSKTYLEGKEAFNEKHVLPTGGTCPYCHIPVYKYSLLGHRADGADDFYHVLVGHFHCPHCDEWYIAEAVWTRNYTYAEFDLTQVTCIYNVGEVVHTDVHLLMEDAP